MKISCATATKTGRVNAHCARSFCHDSNRRLAMPNNVALMHPPSFNTAAWHRSVNTGERRTRWTTGARPMTNSL
eukprot:1281383-Lingulodinium_polyedra.AAC.1